MLYERTSFVTMSITERLEESTFPQAFPRSCSFADVLICVSFSHVVLKSANVSCESWKLA